MRMAPYVLSSAGGFGKEASNSVFNWLNWCISAAEVIVARCGYVVEDGVLEAKVIQRR